MPVSSSTSVDGPASEADRAAVKRETEPGNYPSGLERDVASDDNLHYHVRPIRPDDGARLVDFHLHLLPHSIFLRFFTFHPELSPKEVERFTCVDYVNRLALVAETGDRLIAVG